MQTFEEWFKRNYWSESFEFPKEALEWAFEAGYKAGLLRAGEICDKVTEDQLHSGETIVAPSIFFLNDKTTALIRKEIRELD